MIDVESLHYEVDFSSFLFEIAPALNQRLRPAIRSVPSFLVR